MLFRSGEALYEPLLESRVGYKGGIYRILLPEVFIEVSNQPAIYCSGGFPARPIKIIEVPNQSAIYCSGVLPNRPIKIIELPNQSAIYCLQTIIRE